MMGARMMLAELLFRITLTFLLRKIFLSFHCLFLGLSLFINLQFNMTTFLK